ncbi:cytochrome P450 [Cucurbitaria berberidis CBS 394.84]|uniref:Cytochrome P450 n=1 Tax=Cucurbitaria berberidis CBS 394.84 TaxID=1168544 RepID=A0A9P4L679_9PLEO|nr:cytochrome P450 [Cucurbitaria berberidis CBS 394.84]KAF1843681.1 cytochrome P450 [Cucurbitaria berberidis CBS 394.84]
MAPPNALSVLETLQDRWITCIAVLILAGIAYQKFRPGMWNIPGPFEASISPWWKYRMVKTGQMAPTQMKQHEKYGPLVRIGPTHVSVNDVNEVPNIYGRANGFVKGDFYSVLQLELDGKTMEAAFTTKNATLHKRWQKQTGPGFALTSLLAMEPLVDMATNHFIKVFEERFAAKDAIADFAHYLNYFAYDVISNITFGEMLGMVENGGDVGNTARSVDAYLEYGAPTGQVPFLHWLRRTSTLARWWNKSPSHVEMDPVTSLTLKIIAENEKKEKKDVPWLTFSDRIFQQRDADPESIRPDEVIMHLAGQVAAGGDSTSVSMASIFYHLLKTPRTYKKLCAEVRNPIYTGKNISYATGKKMEYLQACIKEGMRLHPAVGLILERLVPKGGRMICGHFFPEGTTVGINPWVMHYNKDVYGEDVNEFRPERWLEASPEKLREMNNGFLSFGHGMQICAGRNISQMEMTKMIPDFLRYFDLELAYPEREWEKSAMWIVKPHKFFVKCKKIAKSE